MSLTVAVRVLPLLTALSLSLAAPARDRVHVPASVVWHSDLTSALARAESEGRVVLICFNMDGEAANERALQMYASDEFAQAVADVVCVMCSADEHAPAGDPCSRFPGLRCTDHRNCERAARARLYGARRDNIAPQHVVLYPDGLVAWHGVYEVEPRSVLRAIRDAQASRAAPHAQRVRRQKVVLEQLKRRAKNVPAAYMQVLAALSSMSAASFLDAIQVLSADVATTVLDDLAAFDVATATPLLDAAARHPNRTLRAHAERLAKAVRSRPVAPPAPVDAPADAPTLAPEAGEPALPRIDAPLPEIATADPLGRVHWAGDERSLEACRGQITVAWFFLPDSPGLSAEVARMNAFAERMQEQKVRVLGFAVAVRPSEILDGLRRLGCAFPVGAYQATNGDRFFGIERFPAWVVLDPDARVVYRTPQDAASVAAADALGLATAMARSPVYAEALGCSGRE